MRKEVKILNLCPEINSEIIEYFQSRKLDVIDPRIDETPHQWTHILTKDINDFGFIRETYQTIEEDIQIISLTPVKDKQNFVLANGKLCFEEAWLKSTLKEFLLDKFFQDYIDTSLLSENPVFKELGHFSLNQFFSFGDQLDQLTKVAFNSGVPGLAVRTYIDHLIMYLAALKSNDKMELPLEVTYGESEMAFGLQIYFSAQNLMMDDVAACLSLHNSRRAEETLLNTALDFCDFFDFSLISNAQKMAVAALWLKEEETETPSFMLSLLPQKAKIVSYIQDEASSKAQNLGDPMTKITLPEIPHEEGVREVSKDSFSEVISTRIAETVELEKVKKIVQRDLTDDEIYHLLEESAEEEQKIILGSEKELEDVINVISSGFDELEVYKKDFFNENEVLTEVIDSLKEKHSDVMNVKSINEHLPEHLRKVLGEYCQEKKIVKDNLTREHIKDFQVYFLKKNLKKEAVVLNSKGKELIKDLKKRLEDNLKKEYQEEDIRKVIDQAFNNESDQLRVKSIFKNTLKDSLEEKFEFSRHGKISDEEENIIVRSLSSTLEEDKQVIKEIITDEEATKAHKPLFVSQVSEKEKALLVQVESLQQEKKGLADKLQATLMEIKALKESKSTVSSIQSKAADASHKDTQQDHFDENVVLKKEIQEKLAEGNLSPEDQKRLNELMEKELVLMTAVRENMMNLKKLQIEASQKEALFSSELLKLNRQLKARDLILAKSKENLVKLSEKKDAEIEFLKNKVDQAQVSLQKENSSRYVMENKHLKVQNMNLTKQLDVYKAKLNSLSANLKKKEADSSKDELRKVQAEKVQVQNQLSKQMKETQRTNLLLEKEINVTKELRSQINELKDKIKELEKRPVAVEAAPKAQEEVKAPTGPTELELAQQAKIKTLETQVADLETRLAEAVKAHRSGAVDEKKMQHVEASLKKITQDLLDARNQTNEFKKENNKLRQEKTALQNQLDRLKKESMKAKKAG
ncbi:MAG TPA: hypothetical protein VKY27_01120 [Bacteriovoracaceae bacterium]|nr:hypothetical protein [Bacteriovoracaceae bacterium]